MHIDVNATKKNQHYNDNNCTARYQCCTAWQ